MKGVERANDRSGEFFSTEGVKADLKGLLVRSGSYMILSHACQFVVGLATVMILARLLTPRDFGLLAMAEALTRLVNKVRSFGLPAATAQKDSIDHEIMSGLFWLNVKLNVVLALIIIIVAPVLSWFFKEPDLIGALLVLATGILVLGVTNLQLGLLSRQMRFGTISLIELVAILSGSVLGIVLAFLGMGFWALVFQQAAMMFIQAAGFWWCCDWRPRPFSSNRQSTSANFRSMWSFGRQVTYGKILLYFGEDFFRFIIGRFSGASALGLYQVSYRWSIFPFRMIYIPLTSVVVSTLSRIYSEVERYRQYFQKILLAVFTLAFPAFAYFFIEARQSILVLLGPQWLDAVPLFKILVLAAAARGVTRVTKWIYLSEGRPEGRTQWLLIATPITLIAVSIGIKWGVSGVAIGYMLATCVLTYPSLKMVLRASPLALRDVWRALILPAGTTTVTVGVFLALRPFSAAAGDWHPVALLSIHTCLFGCLYLTSWLAIAPCRREISEVIKTLKMLKRSDSKIN